jgi:transposase-like protein
MRDFDSRFPSEAKCLAYLEKLRWGKVFSCLKCGGTSFWRLGDGLRKCRHCHFENRVTVGTIFQDSHLSLKTWFYAIWWITSQKTGVSALGLKGVLGLGSYQTAWLMLQKIRKAMVVADRSQLTGEVEVDETLVGGFIPGKLGRDSEGKRLVIIAAEVKGKKIGRIRMSHIPNASAATLRAFIKANIEPGTIIHTDGWLGYNQLDKDGYIHQKTPSESVGIEELMPKIHLVASLLKRWILGTFQGMCKPKYLNGYLNEFVFRFNRRASNVRGLIFFRVLANTILTTPSTSSDIKQI